MESGELPVFEVFLPLGVGIGEAECKIVRPGRRLERLPPELHSGFFWRTSRLALIT